MQKVITSVFLLTVVLLAGFGTCVAAQEAQSLPGLLSGSATDYYSALIKNITGDYQYGELFTTLQQQWFWKIFLAIIIAFPLVFLLHFLVIGAKHFDHDGEQILFFSLVTRIVHFIAAVSFTLLAITGLMIVFGKYLGGGAPIHMARIVHLVSAIVFAIPAVLMFIIWVKDMLPQLHDLAWMLILGGYLSKEKKPVPAGKFNAGQKMYFWFATVGGGVMAFTGYYIWGMGTGTGDLRLYTIIHNILGMGILSFFITHVYMSVFAIAGSLQSMKTGYKPQAEVDILHSRYKY